MPLFSGSEIFIVTGASSGIGKAVALRLAEENAKVVAIARNNERLIKLKDECTSPENIFVEVQDLTLCLDNMPDYLKNLKEKYGKFSGIAYCAGAIMLKPAAATGYAESLELFKTNYFAPVMMVKSFMDKRICVGVGASAVAVASSGVCLKSNRDTGKFAHKTIFPVFFCQKDLVKSKKICILLKIKKI